MGRKRLVRQPFQFAWEVPESGYRRERAYAIDASLRPEKKAELMLVEPTPVGVARMVKRHRTLKDATALFKTFADIDPTPDGVVSFANQYGALGGTLSRMVTIGKPDAKGKPLHTGEPITAWLTEIAEIRRLLSVWDQDAKCEITFRTAPESIVAEWPSGTEIVVFRATDPETYERLRGKPTEIAQHYLRTKVNAKLLEHPATARLLYEKTRGAPGLFIVPSSLIAAIWLQFAAAIDGSRQYRSCKNCGKWFEVGGSVRRADTEACSASCRAAFAYRKGKK